MADAVGVAAEPVAVALSAGAEVALGAVATVTVAGAVVAGITTLGALVAVAGAGTLVVATAGAEVGDTAVPVVQAAITSASATIPAMNFHR